MGAFSEFALSRGHRGRVFTQRYLLRCCEGCRFLRAFCLAHRARCAAAIPAPAGAIVFLCAIIYAETRDATQKVREWMLAVD